MRGDRSLIPGVGAGISLVAAVACAFFVTAALVAFHSWPQVTATTNARAVIVASTVRAPAIVVSSSARPPRAGARPGQPVRTSPVRIQAPISAVVVSTPRPRRVLAVTPPVQPTAPVGQTKPSRPATPTSTAQLPGALAATTQKTTANVGGVVNGVTNSLASTLAPVSPQLAGTVQDLGNSVSGAVVSVGNSLAQLLLGLPSQ